MNEKPKSLNIRKITKCETPILYIGVNVEKYPDLLGLYEKAMKEHQHHIVSAVLPNSGFDLLIPEDIDFLAPFETKMVDLGIKGVFYHQNIISRDIHEFSAYQICPRSSFSKYPLLLANHVGIIDAGYRGYLMAALRWLSPSSTYSSSYTIPKHTKLLQITLPSLDPFYVRIVPLDHPIMNSNTTTRGEGGFGSTNVNNVNENK
jgi:dUTPase